MKTKVVVFALVLFAGFLSSCDYDKIRASDEISSLEYTIPNYSTLRVSNAFNVNVVFSETEESIRIEANENLHDRIIVKKDGNALVIKLKNLTQIRGNATLNAYITTKDISKYDISGASQITLENLWDTVDGQIELSGSSNFTGEIQASSLRVEMSGSSTLDLFGIASAIDADLSGSSDIRDFDLAVEDLKIDLSGASDAYLSISESIDIRASGASSLQFKGDARISNKNLSGASEIIKID